LGMDGHEGTSPVCIPSGSGHVVAARSATARPAIVEPREPPRLPPPCSRPDHLAGPPFLWPLLPASVASRVTKGREPRRLAMSRVRHHTQWRLFPGLGPEHPVP